MKGPITCSDGLYICAKSAICFGKLMHVFFPALEDQFQQSSSQGSECQAEASCQRKGACAGWLWGGRAVFVSLGRVAVFSVVLAATEVMP